MSEIINEILELLKNKYETATGRVMRSDITMSSPQAVFYFKELEDNLIEPMNEHVIRQYGAGGGNELDGKMKALRSSSVMTFNLFGNHDAVVNKDEFFEPGVYRVSFEKQLATIKNTPRKANIDAVLQSDSEIIFCEFKMLEWLSNNYNELSPKYFKKEDYQDEASYEACLKCIEVIADQSELSPQGSYKSALRQYDAFQMFKHTLAVYNFAIENIGNIPQKIRLVNCVWELREIDKLTGATATKYRRQLNLEHQEFSIFYESTFPIRELFMERGYDFDIVYMNVADFISNFQKSPAELAYLGRYL